MKRHRTKLQARNEELALALKNQRAWADGEAASYLHRIRKLEEELSEKTREVERTQDLAYRLTNAARPLIDQLRQMGLGI